ncbi:DNA repair protein RadA [Candidatus Saccharibacteria bacterium]|nr:DNA repair protein RadA [Candidatus Saccharibacteria bacterium]
MPKSKNMFVCSSCGASYSKWLGQCTGCGEWETLIEQGPAPDVKNTLTIASKTGSILPVENIYNKGSGVNAEVSRLSSGFSDLDLVLGGGILPGSVTLLAGQPGIGKSTLLLQIANQIAKSAPVLYVSGEESAPQVRARAVRLAPKNTGSKSTADVVTLDFASSNSTNDIAQTIASGKYKFVIVDSVQTLTVAEIPSAPGSVSQVANSGNILIRASKAANCALILVGHVTKEGTLAGPKTLEHMVDVVLNFEGDRYGGFKTIRASKNRFGATSELAIFEMGGQGLQEVKNPSAALLAERQNVDGSIIFASIDGTRPLLVEIQALVNPTNFGYPKRTASGFDLNRLNLLIAVLEQRTRLTFADKDIFLNVVGGIRISDAAADLAVCLAIASAAANRKLADDLVAFGEVGLGGEIRSVHAADKRISEAKKLGFSAAIAPHTVKSSFAKPAQDLTAVLNTYLH